MSRWFKDLLLSRFLQTLVHRLTVGCVFPSEMQPEETLVVEYELIDLYTIQTNAADLITSRPKTTVSFLPRIFNEQFIDK